MLRGDDDIGNCDFIDVLEAAIVRRETVHVETREDRRFVDRPLDVVTENGANVAVFEREGRIAIDDLQALSPAGQPHAVRAVDLPEGIPPER